MARRLLASSLTAALLCSAPVSGALAEGFYFGLSGGTSSMDVSRSDLDIGLGGSLADELAPLGFSIEDYSSSLDDSDVSWGLQVGYQWGSYIAAEIGYVDFGKINYDADFTVIDNLFGGSAPFGINARFRSSGPTAAVLGILPLAEKFEIHGRAGVLFARTRITVQTLEPGTGVLGSSETRGNSADFFVGIGAGWNINERYSLRVGYQKFLDVGDDEETGEADVDQISVSFLFR